MEKDIYELEVERLQAIPDKEFPIKVYKAWVNYDEKESPHSCLFDTIGPINHPCSGCLIQIRIDRGYNAVINGIIDRELTEEIRSDERIPAVLNITKESLPVFAEWQRRIKALEIANEEVK